MNSEQNSNLSGINPIPNINPNPQVGNNMNRIVNNSIPETNLPPMGIATIVNENNNGVMPSQTPQVPTQPQPTIPITPIPGIIENNNMVQPMTPIPEQNTIINPTPLPTTNQELKIDSTSPFDIGINQTPSIEKTNPSPEMNIPPQNIPSMPEEPTTPIPNSNVVSEPNTTNINNNVNNTQKTNQEQPIPNTDDQNIVPVKRYLGYLILFTIPIIGFIMLIIKAFGNKKDKNISNLAKAQLLLFVIVIILSFIISSLIFSLGTTIIKNSIENKWQEMQNESNSVNDYSPNINNESGNINNEINDTTNDSNNIDEESNNINDESGNINNEINNTTIDLNNKDNEASNINDEANNIE